MLVFKVMYAKCPYCGEFTSMTMDVCFERCEHYNTTQEKDGLRYMLFALSIEGGSYMEEHVLTRQKTVVLNLDKDHDRKETGDEGRRF